MFGIGKLIFGRDGNPELSPEVQAALAAWQALPNPDLSEVHFHTRYVLIDVASTGPDAEHGKLLGVAALGLSRGGLLDPQDALWLDFSSGIDPSTVGAAWLAFLEFVGKSPSLCYDSAFTLPFVQKALRSHLGVDYQPSAIDLVWLLPALFTEKSAFPLPLDAWLGLFGGEAGGRRDPLENAFVLARLFQRLLERGTEQGMLSAKSLSEESRASNFLRRTH